MLLGVAFVALLTEPTQASAPPVLERIAATTVLELPNDRPARQANALGPAVSSPASLARTERTSAPAQADVATALPQAAVATRAPLPLDGTRVRLVRLGIDLPILPGDTVRDTVLGSTPNGAAFLLPTSLPPGAGGNSYVYAHARAGMFLSLWNARLGDVVEVTSRSGEVRVYVVTEIHPRVAPTDVRHTLPTSDERITLQTSTGPRDADPRFVVVAVRGS